MYCKGHYINNEKSKVILNLFIFANVKACMLTFFVNIKPFFDLFVTANHSGMSFLKDTNQQVFVISIDFHNHNTLIFVISKDIIVA